MVLADEFLDALARWAADVRLEAIPQSVQREARVCIMDVVAAGIAGASLPVSEHVRSWALTHYRAGPAALLTHEGSLVAPAAALVNGVACHAFDFDDTCYDGVVHASTVVFPAALAVSQTLRTTGAGLLLSYCVGCQVEVELGRLLTDRLYDRGWLNTALLGTFGAAAAAGKAMGLSGEEMRGALALAALEAAGIRASLGSEAKPVLAGRAAEAGVRCAMLARQGLRAPLEVLEGPNGFINTHVRETVRSSGAPGQRWAFIDPGFALKIFPVCSAAQAAAEELLALRAERGLRPSEIRSIAVYGSHLVARSLKFDSPASFQQAQFSMPFALACVACFGELGPAQLVSLPIDDPQMRRLMRRTTLTADPMLENLVVSGKACPEPARLVVDLASGESIERFRPAASGMPQLPFSGTQLRAKFDTCASFARLSPTASDSLFERLQHLDELGDVQALLRT